MSDRITKLNDLLRDEVGQILADEFIQDKNTLVTVTGADVSRTLEHATIGISVYPLSKSEDTLSKIKKHIYPIQQVLNKRLRMRPVPKIRFEIDRSQEQAERIEKLLKKL